MNSIICDNEGTFMQGLSGRIVSHSSPYAHPLAGTPHMAQRDGLPISRCISRWMP
jgi:hypothetical protein